MPAKLCPRCGNLYEEIKSKTCPNCFAVLDVIDRQTAQELARARAATEQTPEYRQVKAEEDERWRQQSFGACLGVVGIFLATALLTIVLIAVAAHRRPRQAAPAVATTAAAPLATGLSPLPAAHAALEEVMPARIGAYERTERDEDMTLHVTSTPLFHAAYAFRGDPLRTADIYAVPQDIPAGGQEEFTDAVTIAAKAQRQTTPPRTYLTQHWRYALLGPAADDFAAALAGKNI